MPPDISWIKTELQRAFPHADLGQGVDLDRNGRIDENEKIRDFDQNGVVGNHNDWLEFLKKNSPRIQALGGLFKWVAALKPDNPIHDYLSIISEVSSPEDVERVYQTVDRLISIIRESIPRNEKNVGRPITPQEKTGMIYNAMKDLGITFDGGGAKSVLLTQDLREKKLDCDTSSLLALAVAHEMGWPIYLVKAPNHMFIRWDDGKGTRFNVDQGLLFPDSSYIEGTYHRGPGAYPISRESLRRGVYMKNLTREGLLSDAFAMRASEKARKGQLSEAIGDNTIAINLDPVSFMPYGNRCLGKNNSKDFKGGLQDCTLAIELNPGDFQPYMYRCGAKNELADYEGAIQDCNTAIRMNPNAVAAYSFRGNAKVFLGDQEGAIVDLERATQLEPNNEGWRNNLSIARWRHNYHLSAGPRIGLRDGRIDGRAALGASLNLSHAPLKNSLRFGGELGIAGGTQQQSLDLSAGLIFRRKDRAMSIQTEIGGGYAFPLSGDSSHLVLPPGPFLKYGVQMAFPVIGPLQLGASLYAYQPLKTPPHLAIAPGIDMTFLNW